MPFCEMRLGGSPVMFSPLKRMRPEVGPHDAGQAVEERALARPVRADDGADLAALHLEIDAVERGQAAEADGQVLGAQDGVRFPARRAGKTTGRRIAVTYANLRADERCVGAPGRSCRGAL